MALSYLRRSEPQETPDAYLFHCELIGDAKTDIPAHGTAMTDDSGYGGSAAVYCKIAVASMVSAPYLVAKSPTSSVREPGRYWCKAVFKGPKKRSEA